MANEFPLPSPFPGTQMPTDSGTLPPPEENPAVPPAYQPPQPAVAPQIKGFHFKFIVPVAIGLAVIGVIIFVVSRFLAGIKPTSKSTDKAQAITINYWGLWETSAIMKPVIDAFEAANPGIKVNYQLQSQQDYQDRLQTAIAGTTAPDVARIHSTWLPLFIKNLLPAPANTVSATEIQTNFYPGVGNTVLVNGQVFGVPMNLDGLVLFINTNILRQANLSAPTNWVELSTIAKTLTLRDQVNGKITRAGVALGNTVNIRFWPDIVTLMILQRGLNPLQPDDRLIGTDVLPFYASFALPGQYWDETMPDSVVAFANEKVAVIIAPLWVVPEISAINPALIWQTAPIPQLPDVEPVNWATMWTEIVPKNTPHPQEAWKFVSYLASAKAQQLLFESAIKERNLAQIPANKAVAQIASQNPVNAALVPGLANAKTFYTATLTHDNETALNSRLIKYLEDAVNSTIKRQDPVKIVETLNLGFNQVLSQYRLVNPLPTPTGQ